MPNLSELISQVIEPLGVKDVESIYSHIDAVRKGAISAISQKFPEEIRQEARQGVPIKLLESRTYEGVLAAASWLTELILESKIDHEVVDHVYGGLYLEYIHLRAGEDEQNQKDARDVKKRMGKIIAILKHNRIPGKISPSNNFIDRIEARFEFDFSENFERSIEILEPLVALDDEGSVMLLGNVYEAAGKYLQAKELYEKWAKKTQKTLYYKSLITVLSSLSEHEAVIRYYDDYMSLAEARKEEVVPLVTLKNSIDTDEDLSEMGVIVTEIFSKRRFDAVHVPLSAKARDYVDRELRESLASLNAIGLAITDQSNAFQQGYVNPRHFSADAKSLFAPEYHHIWIRLLYLYAINALVLFDNTPLRKYELFSPGGEEVYPRSILEKLESVVPDEAQKCPDTTETKPIVNPGKVEEFLDFLSEMSKSNEGSLIVTEFFSRYPFRSITEIADSLEEEYEKSAGKKDGKSVSSPTSDTDGEAMETLKSDALIPFSRHFKYSDLTIDVSGADDRSNEEDEEGDMGEAEDDDIAIAGLPGKIEIVKTRPLEDILFFINSVYISPEDRDIQERTFALAQKQSSDTGVPNEKTGRELARINTLEKGLLLSGEGMSELYTSVGKLIDESYGPMIRKAVLFYAADSVVLSEKIPEYLLNDYYLAWYLLVSHLLCADEIDDNLVKHLLEQSVYYVDYLEGVDDLNSMIISCLVYVGLYDLACDFMIETQMVTSPPTFSLFLSCLSYLEEDIQKSYLREIEAEVFPEYEGVKDIPLLIVAIEGDIEEGDEFEKDDILRCEMARVYYCLIVGDHAQASDILSKIDEKLYEDTPDMVLAEVEFLRLRLTIEDDIINGRVELLKSLSDLYERLDFEHKTECISYMLRLSFRKETELQFKLYLDRAIDDTVQIRLWRHAHGLLSDNEIAQRESLSAYATSDLSFMPVEVQKRLIDKCYTWKYTVADPISEFGDIKLQAAYILSNLTTGTSTILDSIHQYAIWLDHYLKPKQGHYTKAELEANILAFESSFGYSETSPIPDQNASRKFSHFLLKHYEYFTEEYTKVQKLFKNNNPGVPFPEDQKLLWIKVTRHFIEMLQRLKNDEIEPVIAMIRESYHMQGGEFEEETPRVVSIQSQFIH